MKDDGEGGGKTDGEGHYWHKGGADYFDVKKIGFEALRVWGHNLDHAGGEAGLEKESDMWKQGGSGVVCLQNLRMSNAQESMMIESMKNTWGGEGVVYRYGDVDKENERHGTMVAVHEQWVPLVHGWLDDIKKWGRYTGVQ